MVQNEHGIASFAALQDALAEGRTDELTCFAFDLLHLDGYDLMAVPLDQRKRALAALLEPVVSPTSALQLSEHVRGGGPAFFAQAAKLGLEGVISKRRMPPISRRARAAGSRSNAGCRRSFRSSATTRPRPRAESARCCWPRPRMAACATSAGSAPAFR